MINLKRFKPNIFIYHGNCPDGFGSAYICWGLYGNDVEYMPFSYNDKVDVEYFKGKKVIIADFSFDAETIIKLRAITADLVILDHHKTAQETLRDLKYAYFDMKKSGAMLTWEYFYPDENPPTAIEFIQDRDLWRWALPNSKEINAYIQSLKFNFRTWDGNDMGLVWNVYERCNKIDLGEAILTFQRKQIEQHLKKVYTIEFAGYKDIPVVNCTTIEIISELVGVMAKNKPFAMAYQDIGDGNYQYSLRSNSPDIDVSVIAKVMGGGGHTKASGFHSNKNPMELN